jgi:hypothetical protein
VIKIYTDSLKLIYCLALYQVGLPFLHTLEEEEEDRIFSLSYTRHATHTHTHTHIHTHTHTHTHTWNPRGKFYFGSFVELGITNWINLLVHHDSLKSHQISELSSAPCCDLTPKQDFIILDY